MYQVRNKMNELDARRDPIKMKFMYIYEQDNDIGVEMSDEDKLKLEGLDDAWIKFQDGLDEA